eukprot:comp15884_c0_seq1/m.13232 comp15884_c0_seq1/g.13232  ORF comp15884_c0_seq1/g.13232 comp15884_c0_seq1/m.13232 type:complete len:222 (-) comp15884_c0_seq1:71-736(-)
MGRRHWLALARYLRYYRISAMVKSGLYDAHRPSVKRLLSSVNDTKYFLFEGNAMLPTIGPGYTLLEARVRPALRRLYKGDVVVVEHPDSPTDIMVRRLTAMSGDLLVSDKDLPTYRLPPNHYWVSCDNEEATFDSRTYGPLHSSHILGRVVHTVASDGRALARVMNSPQAQIDDHDAQLLSARQATVWWNTLQKWRRMISWLGLSGRRVNDGARPKTKEGK